MIEEVQEEAEVEVEELSDVVAVVMELLLSESPSSSSSMSLE